MYYFVSVPVESEVEPFRYPRHIPGNPVSSSW